MIDDLAVQATDGVYIAVSRMGIVKDGPKEITVAEVARMTSFLDRWLEIRPRKDIAHVSKQPVATKVSLMT
ncbi:hypothetical protein F5Y09DRAFT_357412 [Xylaria sp. FL1042]|nr:hypothetical protein F5Y09DRAFT_357412 [Xylaria sp. FL1042]